MVYSGRRATRAQHGDGERRGDIELSHLRRPGKKEGTAYNAHPKHEGGENRV